MKTIIQNIKIFLIPVIVLIAGVFGINYLFYNYQSFKNERIITQSRKEARKEFQPTIDSLRMTSLRQSMELQRTNHTLNRAMRKLDTMYFDHQSDFNNYKNHSNEQIYINTHRTDDEQIDYLTNLKYKPRND